MQSWHATPSPWTACMSFPRSRPARHPDDEITLFKSVGTGIQDIALAAVIYGNARARGVGTDLGTFPYLKRQ